MGSGGTRGPVGKRYTTPFAWVYSGFDSRWVHIKGLEEGGEKRWISRHKKVRPYLVVSSDLEQPVLLIGFCFWTSFG